MSEFFQNNQFYGFSKKVSAINYRLVSHALGVLLWVEAGLFLLCAGVNLWYKESDYMTFIYTTLINLVVGGGMLLYGKSAGREINRRDGYCIVSLCWLMFTTFGMLPFIISGSIPSVTDAFFETMSGFTTTGATILNDIESLSHGLLFWRSLTQWIGGLGIVIFSIALIPIFSESSQRLFLSEATGVTHDKIQPRTNLMVRYLWIVYIALTLIETGLLMLGDMSFFDAICQSFTTTATGGFSTKQASISYWDSAYIEYVVSIFMILSGVNFSLYFFFLKGRFNTLFKDEELHWFLKSVFILTFLITMALYLTDYYDLEKSFRKALFQVATAHTSCGFATDDFNLWPPFTWMLLLFAMVSGGSTGSTSGGVKNLRLLIIARKIKNQFKQLLHPHAILPVRVNKTTVSDQISSNVFIFFSTYLLLIVIGWTALLALGVGFVESLSTVVSSIGNVGPGIGSCGPAYSWAHLPDTAKWVLSTLMFLGRLEIFGILLLFYPRFWKENG